MVIGMHVLLSGLCVYLELFVFVGYSEAERICDDVDAASTGADDDTTEETVKTDPGVGNSGLRRSESNVLGNSPGVRLKFWRCIFSSPSVPELIPSTLYFITTPLKMMKPNIIKRNFIPSLPLLNNIMNTCELIIFL
jgi:hypothetical protein